MDNNELRHKLNKIALPLGKARAMTMKLKSSCECMHCEELDLILETVLNSINEFVNLGDEIHQESIINESVIQHNPREEKR